MLNKFAAAFLIALAVVLTGVAGWGLIYLPDQMKNEAQRTIANLREVLARDAPSLALTHGAISANPFTAQVSVADFSLGRLGGPALKARELAFTIDPFSRRLSAIQATTLRFDQERAQTRIHRMRIEGVTPETLNLLQQASQGEADFEDVVRKLRIPSLMFSGINVTAPREGEMNLRQIAIENLEKGIVGRFSMEGFNLYSRAGANPGEFAVDRIAFNEFNFGEIAVAASNFNFFPQITAPVIKDFSFAGIRAQSDDANLTIGRGALEAVYGINDEGRPYAQKAMFSIEDISIRPVGSGGKLQEFLSQAGMSRIEARLNVSTTGDHSSRTMAMEEMSFVVEGLADVDVKLAMANVPKGLYELSTRPEDAFTLMAQLGNATITGGSLTLANAKFIKLAMEQAERRQGVNTMAMITAMIGHARQEAERRGQTSFIPLADELEKFLLDPKSLEVTLAPPAPVPLHVFMGSAGTRDPAWLIRTLGLTVEANR